jgi:hypothetical protein
VLSAGKIVRWKFPARKAGIAVGEASRSTARKTLVQWFH